MTYTKRVLVGVLLSFLVLQAPPTPDRGGMRYLNPSSDGRFHTCGLVTEHGVTEHLDAYLRRCGDNTFASDS